MTTPSSGGQESSQKLSAESFISHRIARDVLNSMSVDPDHMEEIEKEEEEEAQMEMTSRTRGGSISSTGTNITAASATTDNNTDNRLLHTKNSVQGSEPLEILRYFDPGWFAMTMGTGGTALVIGQIPLEGLEELKYVGLGLWLFNCVLFTCVLTLFTLRFVIYPEQIIPFMSHPVKPFLLGCMPMGMVTCINGIVNYGPLIFEDPQTGFRAAQVLFWINTFFSILVLAVVPFFMFTKQRAHTMESMTAVWLLPIVACEVAGTCGGLVASRLPADDTLSMTVASLMNWAFSVPLALGILVILFLRLALHKLPPAGMGVTCMLALGPLGTGSLTIQLVGTQFTRILNESNLELAEGMKRLCEIAQGLGVGMGVVFWTMCTWWAVIAFFTATHIALTSKLPFNQGWWGFTFPVAVYTLATNNLWKETEQEVFQIFGVGLSVFLIIAYSWVFLLTARDVLNGNVFRQAKPPKPAGPSAGTAGTPQQEQFTKRQQVSVYVNRLISFTNGMCFSVFNPILYISMGKPSMWTYGLALFAFGAVALVSNMSAAFALRSPLFRFKILYFITSCFLVAGGCAYSLGQSVATTFVSRALLGLAVGSHAVTKAFVHRICTPKNLSYEQNMLTASTTLGYVASPFIAMVGTFINFQWGQFSINSETVPGYVIAVIGVITIVMSLVLLYEPKEEMAREENISDLVRGAFSFSSLARFISFFGVGVYESGIPVTLVDQYSYDAREVSFIFLIYAFSSGAAALFGPFLLKHVDFRKMLIFSSLLVMSAFCVLINDGPSYVSQIVVCSVIMGAGCVLLAETSASLLSMVVSGESKRPLYMGVYVSIGYAGRALSGLWVGLTHGVGEAGNPVYYGVAGLVCGLFIMGLLKYKSLSQVRYSKDD
eukprot:Nk52_evm1s273 gene=Nk52_evmTU1s273